MPPSVLSGKLKDQIAEAIEEDNEKVHIKPGIYLGMDFEEYTKIDALNCSRLKKVRHSLRAFLENARAEESPALRFGSLCHCGALEPEEFEKRYVVLPDFHLDKQNTTGSGEQSQSKATKYYKQKVSQFMEEHKGKQEVSSEWMTQMMSMIKNITDHPRASKFFSSGAPEVSMVWIDKKTGLRCKGRIDWLHGKFGEKISDKLISQKAERICDFKTTQDVTDFSLGENGYHIQAYMYQSGWKELTGKTLPFEFIASEKSSPYATRSAPISQSDLQLGGREFDWILQQVSSAVKSKKYALPKDPISWETDRWYKPIYELPHYKVGESSASS